MNSKEEDVWSVQSRSHFPDVAKSRIGVSNNSLKIIFWFLWFVSRIRETHPLIVEKSWEYPSTLSSMRRDTYDVPIVIPMIPYSSTILNTTCPRLRNTSWPDHDHISCPNCDRANLSALTRLVKIWFILKISRLRDSTHWYYIREDLWLISCTIYFQENPNHEKWQERK